MLIFTLPTSLLIILVNKVFHASTRIDGIRITREQWTLCLLAGGSLQLFPSQAKPMGPEHTNRTTTTPSCKSSTKNKSSQTNIDFPNNCPPMYLLVYIQGSKRVLAASHVQAFSRLAFMGLEDPSTQAQSGVVPAVNFQLFCLIHISFLFSCCGCGCVSWLWFSLSSPVHSIQSAKPRGSGPQQSSCHGSHRKP